MLIIKDKKGRVLEKTWQNVLLNDYKKVTYYHKLRKKDEITITCDCQKDGVDMTLAYFKSTKNYHLRNLPSQSGDHSRNCVFHKKYEGHSEHEKGWEKETDENGNETYAINLEKEAFGKKEKDSDKEKKKIKQKSPYYKTETQKRSGRTKSYVTLLGLGSKLNMMAFEDYQMSYKHPDEMPSSKNDIVRQAYGSSRKIRIKRRQNLQDMWFNTGKGYHAKNKEEFFLFAPFVSLYTNKRNKKQSILYASVDSDLKHQKFYVNTDMVKSAISLRKLNLKKDNNGITYPNSFVIGIVEKKIYKSGAKTYELKSVEFLPVTKFGLWFESSYEEEVYTKLHNMNILFTKPYESYEFYNNYTPDILFKRPLNPDKIYIGEIFGIENDEKYLERKKKKLEMADESDLFDFWYWDVPEEDEMDEFY